MSGAPSAPDPIAAIDPQDLPDEKWIQKYKPTREMFQSPLDNANTVPNDPAERVKIQKEYDAKIKGVFENLGGEFDPSKGNAFNQATDLYNKKFMETARTNQEKRMAIPGLTQQQVLWNSLILQARRGNSSVQQRPNMGPYKSFGAISQPVMSSIVGSSSNRKTVVGS